MLNLSVLGNQTKKGRHGHDVPPSYSVMHRLQRIASDTSLSFERHGQLNGNGRLLGNGKCELVLAFTVGIMVD